MKEIKPEFETFARIKVVGVGGSGNHVITRMIEAGLSGVEFIGVNTDSQDLHHCKSQEKIHIGKNLTRGLGAGMNADVGRQAAEENKDEIQDVLKNTDMVFITCGLGGGTGTGAAPIIAEAAKEAGALTVAVVTKPFAFEGIQRKRIAEEGLENLINQVDTIITIPNDKILQVIDKKTLLLDSFRIADDILRQGVQGISDLITLPGIVNVDFADVKSIMQNTGSSLMGIGKASGENRATEAAKQAINSPLLELSIDGAKGVLFNVSGGSDLTMVEVSEAANVITEFIDDEAKVIFGAITDENLKKGDIKVTVIATGFNGQSGKKESSIDDIRRINDLENILKKEDNNDDNNKEIEPKEMNKSDFKETDSEIEQESNMFSPKINSIDTDDEYDVPAFIRKKMKKDK
ncbi:MAG: cell division protein FtsZ [Candidatus Pacebacteria bacterium]|nr:cell division protein FtsZ [Candidatus Paceibacterota bacterium]